jgi:ABC-type enterochelin transport system substrate-binding protein
LFEEDDEEAVDNPYLQSIKIMENSEIIVIDSERLKNSEGLLRHTTAFL